MTVDLDVAIDRAVYRSSVFQAISNCTDCDLAKTRFKPCPFRGPSPTKYMMIGEAPGSQEDRTGKPFVGPSGEMLRSMFDQARLPNLAEWMIANTVCCRSWGPPKPEEVKSCNRHLKAQIRLANPEWVLVLGSTALKATGVSTAIGKAHGKLYKPFAGPLMTRWCFPTFHPAAVLRDPNKWGTVMGDLSTLAAIIDGKVAPDHHTVDIGRGGKMVTTRYMGG